MFATPVGNPAMNIGVAQIRGALIKISIQKIFFYLCQMLPSISKRNNPYIYAVIYTMCVCIYIYIYIYGLEVTHYTESAQSNRSKVSEIYIYIYIYPQTRVVHTNIH